MISTNAEASKDLTKKDIRISNHVSFDTNYKSTIIFSKTETKTSRSNFLQRSCEAEFKTLKFPQEWTASGCRKKIESPFKVSQAMMSDKKIKPPF